MRGPRVNERTHCVVFSSSTLTAGGCACCSREKKVDAVTALLPSHVPRTCNSTSQTPLTESEDARERGERESIIVCMSHVQAALRQASMRHGDEEEEGGERGGRLASADAPSVSDDSMAFPSSPRHVRLPDTRYDTTSGSSSAIASLTSTSTLDTLPTRLDLSPTERDARKGLLREPFFEYWKDDAARVEPEETPEEMQKKDPLGAQIWRLYAKTKGQLPNAERLENLSWRMMAMKLKNQREAERRQG